jgi:hypothetical protein
MSGGLSRENSVVNPDPLVGVGGSTQTYPGKCNQSEKDGPKDYSAKYF